MRAPRAGDGLRTNGPGRASLPTFRTAARNVEQRQLPIRRNVLHGSGRFGGNTVSPRARSAVGQPSHALPMAQRDGQLRLHPTPHGKPANAVPTRSDDGKTLAGNLIALSPSRSLTLGVPGAPATTPPYDNLGVVRRIGLLGGMSWESSAEYYRLINQATREQLGGLHSADCVLRSVDFAEIEELQRLDAWPQAGERLASEARVLEAAGSELLVLCTNTMHKVADVVSSAVGIPLVHIADATADAVHAGGLSTVGLIATAYTMEQDFYVRRRHHMPGIRVLLLD